VWRKKRIQLLAERTQLFERKDSDLFIEAAPPRSLFALHTARGLNDLRAPPANQLEALTGNRRGQHSIRINDQWRICFTWTEEGPADVEIGRIFARLNWRSSA
jgi:toxin HigB-1